MCVDCENKVSFWSLSLLPLGKVFSVDNDFFQFTPHPKSAAQIFLFSVANGSSTCKCCDMNLIMTHWREHTWQIWPDINYSISMANTTKRPSCQVAGMDAVWKNGGINTTEDVDGFQRPYVCLECVMMTEFMRRAVLSNAAVNWL